MTYIINRNNFQTTLLCVEVNKKMIEMTKIN